MQMCRLNLFTNNMLIHIERTCFKLFDLCSIFRKMVLIILILTASFVSQGAGYTYIFKQYLKGRWAWELYHWIGLEKAINRHRFLIFNFSFEYLKRLKSSEQLTTKWIQPPACLDHGLYRILSFYWLAHLYLLKKSAKGPHVFGLDCRMLEYYTHDP